MLDRAGLSLQDFDFYEIHEAFAAQVLCTLEAWKDEAFCRERLGRPEPLGEIDAEKLNVHGGSLATGHPFAATGGRLVASLAKALDERGSGRGVISVCAAGGQGVVAVLGAMSPDRYARLMRSRPWGRLAERAGLPRPPDLLRATPQDGVCRGAALLGAAPGALLAGPLQTTLGELGVEVREGPAEGGTFGALLFDASGIADSRQLIELHRFFQPALTSLGPNGRVIVVGRPPEQQPAPRAHTAQRALEGFTRALAKELGRQGTTVQLVYVAEGAEGSMSSTLRFLLSPASAYLSGQVIRLSPPSGAGAGPELDAPEPRRALVTGAARGIGAAISQVLARGGAHVVGLDVGGGATRAGRVDERSGRGGDGAGHHRARCTAGDPRAVPRGPRHPRPQRRRDGRPDAGADEARALAQPAGDQPLERGANQRGPACRGRPQAGRANRLHVLDRGHRGERRARRTTRPRRPV